jgi:anti-anti-sigma factor
MSIEIQQEQQDSVRVLALSGRLDTETAVDVELALQDLTGAGERNFLIDLSGIGYVSSAGLRVLLSLAKQLDGGKGSLRLCGLTPAVTQVFDVAGFSKLFAIYPDRNTALRSVPKPKPDSGLAQKVAALIGADTSAPVARPESGEVARSAAQLLGIKQPGTAKPVGGTRPPAPAPAKPAAPAAPAVAPAPAPAEPDASVVGKLRRLLGPKR